MTFYAPFCLPFIIGAAVMFAVLAWKWGTWLYRLPRADKKRILFGLPTRRTFGAAWEVVSESLLHRRIFRVNPLLGYMHMSLAFGWFLLIAVGWAETIAYLGFRYVPLQGHVFFKYFATGLEHKPFFDFTMDLLLLFVLSGVALAWGKRLYSRAMGMRRTTKHVPGDRVALSALWFVFPARLVAESATCALYGGGGFLTGSLGEWMSGHIGVMPLMNLETAAWWFYSSCLGVFFVALPFSRYMHIFTEIPLIFLRRYNMLRLQTADNCLMCGRCAEKCPVGIDLNTLRVNSRDKMHNVPDERRYGYFKGLDRSEGAGKVGYFAGCMTLLTPRTMSAMSAIFEAAGEEVWWADREGGVCCGRPLKLAGETDSARKMMKYNADLFRKHGITTLVTSCPICLKVFREDYDLPGIEILHHSEYILRLIRAGRLSLEHGATRFTYHDPCELGRGSGIYDEPRAVIEAVGELLEPASTRENALCCGSSVANTAISDGQQVQIARSVAAQLDATGAEVIVTACPLCKKAIGRGTKGEVRDLAEIVVAAIK